MKEMKLKGTQCSNWNSYIEMLSQELEHSKVNNTVR